MSNKRKNTPENSKKMGKNYLNFSTLFSSNIQVLITSCYIILCTTCICYAQVPNNKAIGMFVFGSSLVDNGNNNYLPYSTAKANFLPYGNDFGIIGTTGRFTNGKNVIDVLCQYLRLPLIPVFKDPRTNGRDIIYGVNFASGGSGILDSTGFVAGQVITLNQQIKNFEEVTLPNLETQLCNRSEEALGNYLFVLGSGGNDYTFNYFLKPTNVKLVDFTTNLTTSLGNQIKKLYQLGGRKFVIMTLNPLGCSPFLKVRRPTLQGCLDSLNQAALLFNANLEMMALQIKPQMPNSTLVIVNTYKFIKDIIDDPLSKGFNDSTNPCCEVEANGVLCKREGQACLDRATHVYFDGLHPTGDVNVLIGTKAFASELQDEVHPINVKQLSMI